MNSETIRRKHKRHLFPASKNFYKDPIVITEGKNAYVNDLEGNSYLDFFGGILTISIGHCNDEVNDAVKEQMDRLIHISSLYPTVPVVELAEILSDITPGKLQKCYFTASGTEAVETAVMMAQLYTGNSELIALRYGYSGRSLLAQSLTAHSSWRALPTQVPSIKHALSPYCYRCPLKLTYPDCGVACAEDVEELIKTTTTGKIAGMMIEPIQGVGGFITPPEEYFKIVAEIIRQHGGIFISDEVQTGFGRTGKMWGIEHYGVEPDMITMAKGIANGFPLSACITTTEISDALIKNTISTFGGNPVSCVAAIKTIEIIERDKLANNSMKMGVVLREGLDKLKEKYPKYSGDVRGKGLMQAVEFVIDEPAGDRTPNPEVVDKLMEETKKRGLLIGRGGLVGNIVRISPPLNINRNDVEKALEILDDSLSVMTN
ncbi:uncharacterized protein METZ01_LOCUS158936 [marine metagenome]|uniref:alanine--glyoxylate transaminase n=1 Tax=marine metagenome TaxID=408172 RepID=A0A382AYE9_9ZZZZ